MNFLCMFLFSKYSCRYLHLRLKRFKVAIIEMILFYPENMAEVMNLPGYAYKQLVALNLPQKLWFYPVFRQ